MKQSPQVCTGWEKWTETESEGYGKGEREDNVISGRGCEKGMMVKYKINKGIYK